MLFAGLTLALTTFGFTMFGETLRVAAGRIFGYARLDRHRSVVKLVPGLATL